MTRRASLAAIVLSTLLIAAAYGSAFLSGGAPPAAAWMMAMGTALVMVAMMALGAARRDGGTGRLALPFAAVFAILAGGFAAALLLPPVAAGETLWLGLPRGAAIVLVGIGLVPMLILPLAYALTFDEMTLGEDDLARVREAARALGAPGSRAHSPARSHEPRPTRGDAPPAAPEEEAR